jgi:AraC family transcriptional regulator
VKKPVNEYIKLRRLSKASVDLANGNKRIMDIAIDSGFSSHTSFTRAFTEAFGISPDEYRQSPVILNQFVKPDLVLSHIKLDENMPLIADGIVVEVARITNKNARTFIGIPSQIPVSELSVGQTTGVSPLGDAWQNFHYQKKNFPSLLPDGTEIGVITMGSGSEGCCTYFTGAESTGGEISKEFSTFTIPCGDFVICRIEAESFAELIGSVVFKANAFMGGWLKQRNLACGNFVAELYFNMNSDGSFMELWLPVKPVTVLKQQDLKNRWDKNNGNRKPSLETINSYVDNDLWEQLLDYLENQHQSVPKIEFSKCSYKHGWNIKYKKGGRSLCTLYPMEGYFVVLIVVSQREKIEFELNLPFFSSYLQYLYWETRNGMGQKWLMIDVKDASILEDVKRCIAIRRGK